MNRADLKRALARLPQPGAGDGATLLIYHRIGGGSPDERDTPAAAFDAQLDALAAHDVVSLDEALDRLDAGDRAPRIVLTFDDGYADVHAHGWPRLRERGLPFTLYLAAGFVGAEHMHWDGSTARASGPALSWAQIDEMVASGLCTLANHTLTHVRPDQLTVAEIDGCSAVIEQHVGQAPRHFAYPWGIEVATCRDVIAERFRSAVTGRLGRNQPDADRLALRRVPVRQSDPIAFFAAKLDGALVPERTYDMIVRSARRLGVRA